MALSALTQGPKNVEFIVSEAAGHRSRESGTLAYGVGAVDAGEVLALADVSITTLVADTVSGSHVVTLDATTGLVAGRRYKITGDDIPAGATFLGPASGLNINLQNAGGTAFVNATDNNTNEACAITENVSGQLRKWVTTDDAAGVAMYRADATASEADIAYLAREAEVNLKLLTFPDSTDDEVAGSLLSECGIKARD